MIGLSFGYPLALGLAAILVALASWGLVREHHRQRKALAVFGEESLISASSVLPAPRALLLGKALQTASVLLGLVALARPQLGERPASLARSGRDVLVLLDLSRSMNAVDEEPDPSGATGPSRLAVAKRAISQILAAVPENRSGLVIFGGSAFLQLPLTENHAAFQRFLDAATTDDLGDPTTDLSSALSAAATAFAHEGERGYQSVLIASDGESLGGDVGPPLAKLKAAGVPVFIVGVGSPGGAPVPADSSEAPERWHRDHIGRVVISRLDESDLRRAARETGGSYVRASPDGIAALSRDLARMERRTLSSRESIEHIDRFQWPLALALFALVVSPAVAGSGRKKPR
jgi:Ca-activated chloride channel homolog